MQEKWPVMLTCRFGVVIVDDEFIIIIILLKFKFGRFFTITQPAYSITNRGGLYNLQ